MAFLKPQNDTQKKSIVDRFILTILIFSFLSILLQISLILIWWQNLPPQLPLFYSRPWGEAMLASKIFLWILPAIAIFCPLINFLTSLFFFKQNQYLKRVLATFSGLVSFTTLYGSLKIVSLLT